MKKFSFIVIPVIALLITTTAFAQESQSTEVPAAQPAPETALSGLQFGPFLTYNQGLGDVFEHEAGNAGGGVDVYYQLPIKLPEVIPFSHFGIAGTIDFASAVLPSYYVEYWTVSDLLVGGWIDWEFNSVYRVRPEIFYGTALNFVKSTKRRVDGVFADQIARIGCTLTWEPDYLHGFAVYGNVNYTFMPEWDCKGNFFGFKAGILYRPENPWSRMKAVRDAEKLQALLEEEAKQAELNKQRLEEENKAKLEAEAKAAEEAAKKAEEERIAAEKAAAEEAARIAAEEAAKKAEEERIAAEKAAAEEAERIAAEEAAKKAEEERIAAEKAAAEEAERIAAEEAAKKAEEERIAAEKAAAEEAARIAAEEAAKKAEEERIAAEKAAAEEAARIAAEEAAKKAEEERIAAEKAAAEEAARIAAEKAAADAKAKTVRSVEVQYNEDGSIYIAIPNLSFKSNSADLTDAKSNDETLAKVYEILTSEEFAEYNCDITGYVNPDNEEWTEDEKSLALSRAQTVIKYLVSKGIDASRLTAHYGSGKSSNKEYNRRVEFKLVK